MSTPCSSRPARRPRRSDTPIARASRPGAVGRHSALPVQRRDGRQAAASASIPARSPPCCSNRSPATWAWSHQQPATWKRLRDHPTGGLASGLRRGDDRFPPRTRRRPDPFRGHPDLTVWARSSAAACRRPPMGPRHDHGPRFARGPIYQAGTLSGNPLAMAAGLATLRNPT